MNAFGLGIILTVLLWFVVLRTDDSELLRNIRWRTFQLMQYPVLQHRASDSKGPPVVIVDISDLHAGTSGVTSRCKLKNILLSLTCKTPEHCEEDGKDDHKKSGPHESCQNGRPLNGPPLPAVIGVDIDFSPEQSLTISRAGERAAPNWRFVDPHDPDFFDTCLKLAVPVFLGISRTASLPVEQWLGLPEYQRLAAALAMDEKPEKALKTTRETPTFANSLASAYLNPSSEKEEPKGLFPDLKNVFLERDSETEAFGVRKVVINYADLDSIRKVDYTQVDNTDRETFKGRMVIIGDASSRGRPDRDQYEVSIRGHKVSGARVQAAAAYTMSTPEVQLWVLRRPWELTADLLLGCIVNCLIMIYRLRSREPEPHEGFLRKFLPYLAGAGFVVIIGFLVDNWILWDGCLIVAAILLLEAFAEELIDKFRHRRRVPDAQHTES